MFGIFLLLYGRCFRSAFRDKKRLPHARAPK